MISLVEVGLALSLSWVPSCVLVAQDHANKVFERRAHSSAY